MHVPSCSILVSLSKTKNTSWLSQPLSVKTGKIIRLHGFMMIFFVALVHVALSVNPDCESDDSTCMLQVAGSNALTAVDPNWILAAEGAGDVKKRERK